jgi:hypothetical protein
MISLLHAQLAHDLLAERQRQAALARHARAARPNAKRAHVIQVRRVRQSLLLEPHAHRDGGEV